MSYAINYADLWRRAARYVAGNEAGGFTSRAPGLRLTVNLKTARPIGLELPTTLLALADEVIE
jgi:putative tryptophan/tyrosine transport system substrate-binding protein